MSNEINICYKISKNEKKVKLFGEEFINNNKNIYKIIIGNKEYELQSEFNIENYDGEILNIKLKGIRVFNIITSYIPSI